MSATQQHSREFVLPSAHATQLDDETAQLRADLHRLEKEKSGLDSKVRELEGILLRLKQDDSSLRNKIQESEVRLKQLNDDCDSVLNYEKAIVRREWEKHVRAYRGMRTAKERVIQLERKIKAGEIEELRAELMSPPSPVGSPSGCQSSEERDGVEFGPDDWIEGVLTPLHSPSLSPLVTPDANITDVEEDGRTAPREGSTGDNDDSESHMTSAKEPQSEENWVKEAAGDQSVALVPFPTGEPVPKWFKGAFRCLNVSIGGEYLELVGHWVVIERLKGWKTGVRGLNARSRPQDLRKFMSSGKTRWDYGPHMGETFVRSFSSSVRTWWRSLRTEKDWRGLNRCGQSGWCLLLVCMKWWATGIADMEDSEEKKAAETEWMLVLEEMNEAAQGLRAYLKSEAEA
uniref:Uncharacterized protein n=1 Tax=Marasmius tenuissimus TaxID=585030 RepID=A0ABR2ZA47_9AGAR